MKKYMLKSVLMTMLLSACGENQDSKINEAPNSRNSVSRFGLSTKTINELPKSGSAANVAWSDTYWPTYKGGLSNRWQTDDFGDNFQPYLYDVLSSSEVRNLNNADISELSPAEKFDLWMGDSNFSLTKHEQSRTRNSARNGHVETWMGLCHGWAPAAILEAQAGNVAKVSTPDGKTIEFYSSDIKALMIKVYADANLDNYFVGGRCNDQVVETDAQGRPSNPDCRDTNPATFHLVVAEYLGVRNQGFVIDVTRERQVWNQPIQSYSFSYHNERLLSSDRGYLHAAAGTKKLIDVTTKIKYIVETAPRRSQVNSAIQSLTLEYTLELSENGTILGGEWLSDSYPDFMWVPKSKPTSFRFGNLTYNSVKKLLDISLGGQSGSIVNPRPTPGSDINPRPTPDVNSGENYSINIRSLNITRRAVSITGQLKGNFAKAYVEMLNPAGGTMRKISISVSNNGNFSATTNIPSGASFVRVSLYDANDQLLIYQRESIN